MNQKEILVLSPVGKDYLWGGDKLNTEYHFNLDLHPFAEAWVCSVHPDGPSIVANGKYKNRKLSNVLDEHPEYLGTKVTDGQLPILVKLIDAKKDLSVQVHPDDEYAKKYENGQNGKTELWYVLEADEGAKLVYGFEHPVDENELKHAIQNGTLENELHFESVHKGDVFLVEAGMVHAIGKGILLAEIQESSNLTYRLYDYSRIDKNGQKRELHFDKAMDVLNTEPVKVIRRKPRKVNYFYGCTRELLSRCKYFEVEKIQVTKGFSFSVKEESFQILLCTNGEGGLEIENSHNKPVRFHKGSCLFVPAGIGRCFVLGECELIKVRC